MKVMFVIPRMNGGGAERVVANLANALSAKNKVQISTLVSNESFYELNDNVDLVSSNFTINRKNAFSTFFCYAKFFLKARSFIKKQINNFKPDCVISFLPETDIITYLVTRNNKEVIKVFSERNDPNVRNHLLQNILNHIYKKSDLFVCQGKTIYNYYSFISSDKKAIIPNPINNKIESIRPSGEKNHNIVAVGKLMPQKNFKLLIKSFILSIEKIPNDCNLIIYGEGSQRGELEKLISENEMEHRIFLPGSTKNIYEKIKNEALFIMSSDFEGFPNALLEAMAVGLPVISTNFSTGIALELISDNNGLVVPVGNEQVMSDAIVKIMNNDKKRRMMRKNYEIIREKYNVEKIMNIWIDKIESIVGDKNE